jgi:hypothetical protein
MEMLFDKAKEKLLPFECWEKLAEESAAAFAAFCVFRDFGGERNIKRAVEAVARPSGDRHRAPCLQPGPPPLPEAAPIGAGIAPLVAFYLCKHGFSLFMSLLGGLDKPIHRFCVIFRYAFSMVITKT